MIFWPNTKINELLTKAASVSAAYSTDVISGKATRQRGKLLSVLSRFREFYVDKPKKVSYRFKNRLPKPGLGRGNTDTKISDWKRQGVSLAFLLAQIWRIISTIRQVPTP